MTKKKRIGSVEAKNRPDQVHIIFPTLTEEKVNLPQSRQMAPLPSTYMEEA